MTNGEKLCIDFPDMHYTLSEKQTRRVVTTIGVCASFDLDWWNAEYKEPTTKNDLALIHTEGLDEEIRCTMCTNYMKSVRGCDGSCVVNKDMYKAVMDTIEKRIQPSVTPQLSSGLDKNSQKLEKNFGELDCISRAEVQTEIEMNASRYTIAKERGGMGQVEWSDQLIEVSDAVDIIRNLPSVTPQESRWIPVSEKLPEINEEAYSKDVLLSLRRETKWDIDVCRKIHITTIGHYDVNAISSDGVYLDTEGWVLENERRLPLSDVLAWMPLPKAYEPQESEVNND